MIRIAKQSRLPSTAIIERASQYFGIGGQGLAESERHPCCIYFEGVGGYVAVSVVDEAEHRTVEVETREFEYQAKRFLEKM